MRNLVFLVIGVLVLLLALDGVYEVKQTERAVLLRFGAVERADVLPGLHFKWPIADSVKITDARVLTLDSQAERYYAREEAADRRFVREVARCRRGDVLYGDVVR